MAHGQTAIDDPDHGGHHRHHADVDAGATEGEGTAGAMDVVGLPPTTREAAAPPPVPDPDSAAVLDLVAGRELRAPSAGPGAGPTLTELALSSGVVFRGDHVEARGAVTDARGRPVSEGTVRVLLLLSTGERVRLLGHARLDPRGRFEARIMVPADQPAGDFQIVAEFMGTPGYAPSVSP